MRARCRFTHFSLNSSEVTYQHDIAARHAAGARKPLTIGRPREAENLITAKVAQLPGWSSIKRLFPYIGNAADIVYVEKPSTVTGPLQSNTLANARRYFCEFLRLASFNRKNDDRSPRVCLATLLERRDQLSIG